MAHMGLPSKVVGAGASTHMHGPGLLVNLKRKSGDVKHWERKQVAQMSVIEINHGP